MKLRESSIIHGQFIYQVKQDFTAVKL